MLKGDTDQLYQLIKSLTKAEKRNFKLYANRINPQGDVKFIKLFDVIDQLGDYDEKIILQKADTIKASQLSNTKGHLYKQILKSLRLTHINHSDDIEIRENIDYAKVLYEKGLYKQSLRVLDKAKQKAQSSEENMLRLEIVDFEKLIEGQYITRSMENRAEQLTSESSKLVRIISREQELSNMALSLYGLYLKVGCVRNEKEFQDVSKYFYKHIPDYKESELTFFERLGLYQCYVWYNYIIQDFIRCYKYAQSWVELFKDNPDMIERKPDLYVKGLHNLLAALFNIQHYSKFEIVLKELEGLSQDGLKNKSDNTEILVFIYSYNNRINKHFMEGTFTEGLSLIPEITKRMEDLRYKMDHHRVLLFYYKIACLYFGHGDNQMAIRYLNEIINFKDVQLREDIHGFARILSLIAHYELGNTDLLEYHIKSVFRHLVKKDNLQKVQKEIIKFLRRVPMMKPELMKTEFLNLKLRLVDISNDHYEKRAFLYLDIISWLESKVEDLSIQDVIKRKFEEIKKRRVNGFD